MSSNPEGIQSPEFGDLPEHARLAIFHAAWRNHGGDVGAYQRPPRRNALRLVSREARGVVDGLITGVHFWGQGHSASESEQKGDSTTGGEPASDGVDVLAAELLQRDLLAEPSLGSVYTYRVYTADDGPELDAFIKAAGSGRFAFSSLRLHETTCEPAHVDSLLRWQRLEELHLEGVSIGSEAMRRLSHHARHHWPVLRQLHITGEHDGQQHLNFPFCARAIVHGRWPNLTVLNLSSNKLHESMGDILYSGSRRRQFPMLETLRLCDNELKDEGVRLLVAEHCNWACLQVLDLESNSIGAAGAEALAAASAAGRLPALRTLVVSRNCMEDDGVCALARAPWPRLESLCCAGNQIVCGAADALAAAGRAGFPALTSLQLDLNRSVPGLRHDQASALAAAFPGISFVPLDD